MRRRQTTAALLGTAAAVILASAPMFWSMSATASDPCKAGSTKQIRACKASVLPKHYPVTAMGRADFGRGTHVSHAKGRSLKRITAPKGKPDRTFTLVAAKRRTQIGTTTRRALTFNRSTPGPTLTVDQGDLVKVVLKNKNIREGTTIHWHGVDVPASQDGVAGVTQNAVLPGKKFVYRFVAEDAGTYWYHSHQYADSQIRKGLFGALVVRPTTPPEQAADFDLVAAVHTYGSRLTINGESGTTRLSAPPNSTARVRFINTNNGPVNIATSGPFRVVAIDGTETVGAYPISGQYVEIPAGGRADLLLAVGSTPIRVGVFEGPSLLIGPSGSPGPLDAGIKFDRLTYGTPSAAGSLGAIDRRFRYIISQRSAYLNGQQGNWYHINGKPIPKVPMYMVRKGDVVRLRYTNNTPVSHPMHLHGHHALVISRNGQPAIGSPWWIDSLEVSPGEKFVLEFKADNPGVWMFHCHNLPHVAQGLMTHLGYGKVHSPYEIGRVNRRLINLPE